MAVRTAASGCCRTAQPVAVPVVVGLSDGKRTEIVKGELKPGQAVIVDRATAKK